VSPHMSQMQTDGIAQLPKRLQPGARIGIVAPSSGILERSDLERGVAALRKLDLEPVLAAGVTDIYGYLAGQDAQRAEDLMWALSDDSIDAVWCARGGYGAQRTVAALAPDAASQLRGREPKPVIGYSDITVIHAFLSTQLGWKSFYGPTVCALGQASDYTLAALKAALFATDRFSVAAHPDDDWISTLVPGVAEAPLAGGCLTLLAALCGTPLQVDFNDRICFFEDVSEVPPTIDRYLSQLLAAGCFEGCRGILIGEHTDTAATGGSSLGLEQVFADLLKPLGVPCCHFLPIGHGKHLATLPIGAQVRLDADRGVLDVLEPAVR
jgi:muramoyltetrapeptide carboxypeptidase